MNRRTMVIGLKCMVAVLAALVLIFFFACLPVLGKETVVSNPEFSWAYWPCLIWAWVFMLPILAAALPAWQIFDTIRESGQAFCHKNAGRFRLIGHCATAAALIFLCGMLVLAFQGAGSAPLTFFVTPLVVFFCLALAFVCHVMDRLVEEAAALKEENELTI